jgi:26S proteasome regulatory subunit N1
MVSQDQKGDSKSAASSTNAPTKLTTKSKDKNKETKKELSEEDRLLKEELDSCVARLLALTRADAALQRAELEHIATSLRAASSETALTSVPKPLKFMRPHYTALRDYATLNIADDAVLRLAQDILSFLAMTLDVKITGSAEASLTHKLMGNREDFSSWGHDYVRQLSGSISSTYATHVARPDLDALVSLIIPYYMKHNSEVDACDLLLEIGDVQRLVQYVDRTSAPRVCEYLETCAPYLNEGETQRVLDVVLAIFRGVHMPFSAMRLALRLNNTTVAQEIFDQAPTGAVRAQLAYLCSVQGVILGVPGDDPDADTLSNIFMGKYLSQHHTSVAEQMDVAAPRHPDDIYKTTAEGAVRADSARLNLASTYVNAFAHAGLCKDALDTGSEAWIVKNKNEGQLSAVAGLGLVHLWDLEMGASTLSRYDSHSDGRIVGGALLGYGLVHARVRDEFNTAFSLISDKLSFTGSNARECRIGALLGLAAAYCCTAQDDVRDTLLGHLDLETQSREVVAMAALALGMVMAGSGDEDCGQALLNVLLQYGAMKQADEDAAKEKAKAKKDKDGKEVKVDKKKEESDDEILMRLVSLGLGLVFLGKEDASDAILEAIGVVPHRRTAQLATVCVRVCAWSASGNVLRVQEFLRGITSTTIHLQTQAQKEPAEEPQSQAQAAVAQLLQQQQQQQQGQSSQQNADNDPLRGFEAKEKKEGDEDVVMGDKSKDEAEEDEEASLIYGEDAAAMATLGIALTAFAPRQPDDIQMAARSLDHVLQYSAGSIPIRRAVPMAQCFLHVSAPDTAPLAVDVLSKLTHDHESSVAQAAILAIGILALGSNHARVAQRLRQLISYYSRDPAMSFFARLSLGLLSSGKGLLTISPLHADGGLVDKRSLVSLIVLMFSAAVMPVDRVLGGKYSYLVYLLAPGLRLKTLRTVVWDAEKGDEEKGKAVPVPVRVGQAVDTVAQAGHPRRITGFQTHDTPVILGAQQRAEIATLSMLAELQKDEEKEREKNKKKKPLVEGQAAEEEQKKKVVHDVNWKAVCDDAVLEHVVVVERDVNKK